MADEQESIAPPPELDTPAIETPEQETEAPETILDPGEEPEIETAEEQEAEAEPVELVTIERNGKSYQIPKELEGELLMQQDYTKKTQGVSQRQKELDAREAEIASKSEATEAELTARSTLADVNAKLEQYKNVDWVRFSRDDPLGAQEHRAYRDMLLEQQAEATATVTKAQEQRTQAAQQDLAKRIEDTLDFARKEIPGWKPEMTKTLAVFAEQEMGLDAETIKKNWSPQLYKLLHRAHLGEQLLKKQSAPPKPAAPVVPVLETVTGKASPGASRTLADLAKSDDVSAFAEAFQARMAKRGR